MKKLLTLLWMTLYPVLILAQVSAVTEETSRNFEFTSLSSHEILFQLRSDKLPSIQGSSAERVPVELINFDFTFTTDTTWTYDERAERDSVTYSPKGFSQKFDIGVANNFVRYEKSYIWDADSAKWISSYIRTNWVSNDRVDSTLTMRYGFDGAPLSGDRNYYIHPPSEGASEEVYQDVFHKDSGWIKNVRYLNFSSDDNSLRWSKTYRYDPTRLDYLIANENVTEINDGYTMYEYKSYTAGVLSYWNWYYTKLDSEQNTQYTVSYFLNATKDGLSPADSVAYVSKNEYAEAKGYVYNNGAWNLNRYSRTFEHASLLSPGETVIDSVLSFTTSYDSETDSVTIIDVINKTEWVYDVNENLIEHINYSPLNGEMIVFSKSTTEYLLLNGEYQQTVSRMYQYSHSLGEVYLQSEWHTLLDDKGEFTGDLNFYFSETGDTTSGYMSVMVNDDDSFYSFNYQWEPEIHDFVKTGFMMHSEGVPITQYGYYSANYSSDRSIVVSQSMPAAVNPGPLFPVIGDTLDIIISAYNPDMTHPALSINNLPETATFNQETRRLYWEVDEEVDRTFTITASHNGKSTTVDAYIVFGEFLVDNERESDQPKWVVLHQNYPNPFNPNTTISFELTQPEFVSLEVFNVLGQQVNVLVQNEWMTPGHKRFNFDAGNLSSGVYYYRLDAGDVQFTKKMTLIK